MTQRSRPQSDNRNNGFTDAGPYLRDEWAERIRAAHTGDLNTVNQRSRIRGVVPTYDNMLVSTFAGTTLTVGTGAGLTHGSYLFNDAAMVFLVGADPPLVNPRIDVLCLVENNAPLGVSNGAAANGWIFPTDLADYDAGPAIPGFAARLVIVKGAENAAPVAPVLDISTTLFMIPLYQYQVSIVPAISGEVDRRAFADIERIVGANVTANTAIHDAAILGTEVNNGVGAAGLGVGLRARLENDAGDIEEAGQAAFRWTDATNGSEDARYELRLSASNALNLSAVINAPTTASADGNARGAGAVDLQQVRNAVTQVASGVGAFIAGGANNTASAPYAHAEGEFCEASGIGAHVEGVSNVASGYVSHAEGRLVEASGDYSHAEGSGTTASGNVSHAEGENTTAEGAYCHAAGRRAKTGINNGVFIWADSENADFTADNENQFKVRASGGTSLVQNTLAAALPVLRLTQTDQDETFVDFVGTSGAGTANSISTMNGGGVAVDGPLSGAGGWTFNCMIKVDVNGAAVWIPAYTPV